VLDVDGRHGGCTVAGHDDLGMWRGPRSRPVSCYRRETIQTAVPLVGLLRRIALAMTGRRL
jgi:hypothetical protein